MLQIEDFIKRLEFIMEHFGLNASSFADKVNVQRSSISHLLSGRNKPSLDFIMKIIDEFPSLNLYWLLDGKGEFLKNDEGEIRPEKPKHASTLFNKIDEVEEKKTTTTAPDLIEEKTAVSNEEHLVFRKPNYKQIIRIVNFYADGTFEDYKPSDPKQESPNP